MLRSGLGRSDLGVGRLMLVQNSRSWSTFVAHSMVGKTTSPCSMMTSLVVVISSGGTASLMSKCSASAGATDGALEWNPDEVREAEQELRASARRRRASAAAEAASAACARSSRSSMASVDVEVDVESTSCTLSDDSTSTMGTAMSTVAARDDEAIADDEAAAEDEATVIAESVGVRDEAIVSGELLMLTLSGLRLIT